MNCQIPNEDYLAYAVGALEGGERSQLEQHLRDGCDRCVPMAKQAVVEAAAMMEGLVTEGSGFVEPPLELRRRVLGGFGLDEWGRNAAVPSRRAAVASWGWIAASVLLGVAGWLGWESREANAEAARLRAALRLSGDSAAQRARFTGEGPRGSVTWSRDRGFVLVASNLNTLPKDRVYQAWLVPNEGAPQPAGTFVADSDGRAIHLTGERPDPKTTKAVALSVEPVGGSKAPTTSPFLIVPLLGTAE
jgi:anti-sigma-K factor RskA